jgi:NAD(P)-dependent dehydrogenase (short-subunit alcohol dehydrogenase family)
VSAGVQADLRGRVCLVTGANSGIGRETARGLARLGAHVVMACRNAERGEAARAQIAADTGNPQLELAVVDLASQPSIRTFARAFSERRSALHVLVNNAGIWSETRRVGPDGIELVWATNMLGYSLLTSSLLEPLRRGAPSRVVNVASRLARDLDLEDVEFVRRRYSGVSAYAQSKQANRMWTWALARRLEGEGVVANAVHPGGVNTALFSKGGGPLSLLASLYMKVTGRSPSQGADTVVWLAASPDVAAISGRFFSDRAERPCAYRGVEQEERLFGLCERMAASGR